MATILLVAGPPASAALWKDVVPRFAYHGHRAQTLELWDPIPTDPTVTGLAKTVADAVQAAGDDVVLIAHGTAVPVARAAADRSPPRALVLCNGPIDQLDAVTAGVARAPAGLASALLRPAVWNRWLASSAGLRRTVVNPYVMDRDTVVALTAPYTGSAAGRRAVAAFLADLRTAADRTGPDSVPTALVWGTDDPLYPPGVIDTARTRIPGLEVLEVPGGQHFHPLERPWWLADAVAEWLAGERSTGQATG